MKIKELKVSSVYYPQQLKNICQMSPLHKISYAGTFKPQDKDSVIIVGSRECTPYGRKVTNSIVKNLVANNITIISGLAYGIDLYAHTKALEYGGRTIGFLGYGFDMLTKPGIIGAKTAKEILGAETGVIVSPFPADQSPTKDSYIYRNYVMAAFGKCVIVVEAGKRSGTFHTANAALSYGTDVFAVPGSVFSSRSTGTHNLIRDGACLLQDFREVLNLVKTTNLQM